MIIFIIYLRWKITEIEKGSNEVIKNEKIKVKKIKDTDVYISIRKI